MGVGGALLVAVFANRFIGGWIVLKDESLFRQLAIGPIPAVLITN